MKLKKVILSGFKSFAERTELKLDAGLTVIVGPNGCGKSNISDAVRWVLGEQSAKSLRGHKMQDVIFSGTEKRKALGRAEVSLCFAEVTHLSQIDFAEVAITRRLYRDGESEYLLNKRSVRLKDIQDFFLGSGIGRDAFAIFEQGKIDLVIQNTPLERRNIFEEAAGITRFLQRRKETLKQLELSDNHLVRIKDQHAAALKQAQLLQRQAQEAERFNAQKLELEQLEAAIIKKKMHAVQSQIESLEKSIKEWSEEQDYLMNSENEKKARIQESKCIAQEIEKDFLSEREQALQIQSDLEIKRQELKFLEEEHARAQLRVSHLSNTRLESQKTIEKICEQRLNLRVQIQEAYEQIETLKKELSEQQNIVFEIEREAEGKRALQYTLYADLSVLRQKGQTVHIELKKKQFNRESLFERIKDLEKKESAHEKRLKELIDGNLLKRNAWLEMERTLDCKRQELLVIVKRLEDLEKQLSERKMQFDEAKNELAQVQARFHVLNRLKEEMEGYSLGAKKLLQESKKKGSPLYGMISQLTEELTPIISKNKEKDAQLVLESLSRYYGQTLLVQTKENFLSVLHFAEEHLLKEFSLLCIPLIYGELKKKQDLIKKWLDEHFMGSKIIVKTMEQALDELKRQENRAILIQQGVVFDDKGVFFSSLASQSNMFKRESELLDLSTTLQNTKQEYEARQTKMKGLDNEKIELVQHKSHMDIEVRKLDMRLLEMNMILQRSQKDHEDLEKELQGIKKEKENLHGVIFSRDQEIADLFQEDEKLQEKLKDLESRWQAAESEMRQSTKHLQDRLLLKQKVQESYQAQIHKHFQLEQSEKILHEKEHELTLRIESNVKEAQSFQAMGIQYEKDKASFVALVNDLQQLMQKKESSIQNKKHLLVQQQQACSDYETQMQLDRHNKEKAVTALAQLQADLVVKKELFEQMRLEFIEKAEGVDLTIYAVESQKGIWESRVKEIRKQLQQTEHINFAAVQEYQNMQEKEQFLYAQLADLEQARQEILDIVHDLDSVSRTCFTETFESIRSSFKKNFSILFQGGEADLNLTGEKDILEAGIEISAKPPGKEMRLIQLMSGGEKCLTALALLFAFFEIKPSPFCILDEVDAPLDETNVERFGQMIQRFTDQCQFLIVTHNKKTMAIADTLLGVSMEEKGVSKVLTLDFQERDLAVDAHQGQVIEVL